MRILELTAHVQTISRTKGRSATAAAAYRACDRIACDREHRVHDYRRKAGLEAAAIVLPAAAPEWAGDRSRLWNAAEARERNGSRGANAGAWKMDATVAREVLFGFPAELSPAGRVTLAERIARHLAATHGVAVDFAIHAPGKLGDQRNHHCHMMWTTRRLTGGGLADKTREWDSRFTGGRTVTAFRATIAAMMNEALAGEGVRAVHVEHRSLAARGISRLPTKHQGPGKTNAGRKRQARERAAWEKGRRREQTERHGRERDDLLRRQQAASAVRGRDIDEREAAAIERARPVAPPPPPPSQPGGLSRIFRALTGRAEPAAAPPPAARPEHERAMGDLRATFQAERDRAALDLHRETRSLDDRQQGEDRQLDRVAAVRADRDRADEVQQRRDEVDRQHERTHERTYDRPQDRPRDHDDRERDYTR